MCPEEYTNTTECKRCHLWALGHHHSHLMPFFTYWRLALCFRLPGTIKALCLLRHIGEGALAWGCKSLLPMFIRWASLAHSTSLGWAQSKSSVLKCIIALIQVSMDRSPTSVMVTSQRQDGGKTQSSLMVEKLNPPCSAFWAWPPARRANWQLGPGPWHSPSSPRALDHLLKDFTLPLE